MYKFLPVLLAIILTGCSTVTPLTVTPPTEYIVSETRQSAMSASATMPEVYSLTELEMNNTVAAPVEKSTAISVPVFKKVVKVVKAVKVALADPDPVPKPLTILPPQPQPAPLPAPTGAKIQILGVNLEFWVGNSDSWSTVWKLIVLVLFVYGGLRLINLLIQRGERALAV